MSKDKCFDFYYAPVCFLKLQQPVFVIEKIKITIVSLLQLFLQMVEHETVSIRGWTVTLQISSAGRPFQAPDFLAKSVISVFEKPPNRTPKITETHRKSPKAAAGARAASLGMPGGHTWCRSSFPPASMPPPGGKPATARRNPPSPLWSLLLVQAGDR